MLCPKGFLLVEDENRNIVPYFVKVREKDIVTDERLHNSLVDDFMNLSTFDSVNFESHVVRWKITSDRWFGYIYEDKTFCINAKYPITELFDNPPEDYVNRITGTTTEFPVDIVNDSNLIIHTSLVTNDYELMSSFITTNPTSEDTIKSVGVTLTNFNPMFKTDFKTSEVFNDSYVMITISGNLN